jgi:hypothetical protein
MLTWAGQDRQLAVTPDGPRGPAEQVKPGALYLAERTGRRMVPIGVAAQPTRALKSWDRFRVPWPFARVLISHGVPFDPAAWPAAQTAGVPGPAASRPAPAVAPGTPAVASAGATAGSNDEARAECARREFERALGALTLDVRTRVGERL